MSGSVGSYTQGWFPWQAEFSKVNSWTRNNNSSALAMGFLESATTQNTEIVWNAYMDSVTWKFAMVHLTAAHVGIYSIQLDGSTQGTIDGYSAGTTFNAYSEITGIAVATAGVKALKLLMATKNASSTGYAGIPQSVALIRTSGTASTPGGTDTPGYTWQHVPWMGYKGATGTWASSQGSTVLGGGVYYNSTHALNDEVHMDVWLDAGTFKYAHVYRTGTNQPIETVKIDGSSIGTIDMYAAVGVDNVYSEITGVAIAAAGVKNFQIIAASKNASSSDYYMVVTSFAWVRTGA